MATEKTLDRLEALFSKNDSEKGIMTETVVRYQSETTGTVVVEVYSYNGCYGKSVTEYVTWAKFFVGNESGWIESETIVHSEASITYGRITEDADKVVIPRSGFRIGTWGMTFEVSDLVFAKNDFHLF